MNKSGFEAENVFIEQSEWEPFLFLWIYLRCITFGVSFVKVHQKGYGCYSILYSKVWHGKMIKIQNQF